MNQLPLSNVQTRDIESVLHPYTPLHRLAETGPLVMARGSGVYLYDTQGKEYIEGMAGLWCAGLGFGDEEMIEAANEQMRTLPYYHLFGAKGMEPATELAEALKELAPVPVSKVFFTSSGSEANDTQVKLAWYMNNALGRPDKKKIISRVKAYHGVTIMSGSLTGLPFAHKGFRSAGRPRFAYGLSAPLSIWPGRRERGGIRAKTGRQPARTDRARRPRHDRCYDCRTGHGRRRSDRAAGRVISRRSNRFWTNMTSF